MKRLIILNLIIAILLNCMACNVKNTDSSSFQDEEATEVVYREEFYNVVSTKDSVDEFFQAVGNLKGGGLLTGVSFDKMYCFNVTPEEVANQTDYKIFKFSNSSCSCVMIDGAVYELCASFGGHGFVNAFPCDFDEDGVVDLLVASSWGSGMHRSEISVFNVRTKKSTVIYSTADTDNPRVELFILKESSEKYTVFTADELSFEMRYSQDTLDKIDFSTMSIEDEIDMGINLKMRATGIAGYVSAKDGVAVFEPYIE
ncbi:MAG: hypothetical protein IJB96_03495 [Lachnospira sp.]|nr:hypothetical protein [Lachnospira sp.]